MVEEFCATYHCYKKSFNFFAKIWPIFIGKVQFLPKLKEIVVRHSCKYIGPTPISLARVVTVQQNYFITFRGFLRYPTIEQKMRIVYRKEWGGGSNYL